MKLRERIYAFMMVAIYVVATTLSSASLLLCDHHSHHSHHTHHVEHHDHSCSCHGVTISDDCCNHHHPILGDNHTDYIAAAQRSDSRAAQAVVLLLSPAVVPNLVGEIYAPDTEPVAIRYGDEQEPLRAALVSCATLRAPPALA